MKKALSIILAISLFAAMLPISVFNTVAAGVVVDYGIKPISSGETKTATIEKEGGSAYFIFSPKTTGCYVFYSSADEDTCGSVLDKDMQEIISDDDGGMDGNFLLSYKMTAGETYIFEAKFYDSEETGAFDVTLIPSPIAKLEVKDVDIIENTHGSYYYDDNDELYFEYYYYPTFSVTLTNGQVLESDSDGIYIDGMWYFLNHSDNQYNNHWSVGNTYIAAGSLLGLENTFNITITESPVKSIAIEDLTIIENTHGYLDYDDFDKDFFLYTELYPSYTATLKNGEIIASDANGCVEIEGESYYPDILHNQYYEHWTVGNTYTASASFLGASADFNVEIIENPVKSIEIENISVLENSEGRFEFDENSQEYFYYSYYPSFKVTLNDGKTLESDENGCVEILGDIYWLDISDNQYQQHWEAGNTYTATGFFLDATADFDVEIVESPVKSIEISDISIIEKTHCYTTYDFEDDKYLEYTYSPYFKATLKSGEILESDEFGYIEIDGDWYCLTLLDNQCDEHWTVGNTYTVTGEFLGAKDEFEVTIIENPIKNLEIEDTTAEWDDYGNLEIWFPEFTVTLKDDSKISSSNGVIIMAGVQYYIDFEITDDLELNKPVAVTGYIGEVSATFNITLIKSGETAKSISGTVTSFGSTDDTVTIALYEESGTEKIAEKNFVGNSINYIFNDIFAGDYILKISKKNHETQEIEITVDTQDITANAKIQLKGDINGDGVADKKDLNILKGFVNRTRALTDYEKAILNLNGDSVTDKKDLNLLKKHINKTQPLW